MDTLALTQALTNIFHDPVALCLIVAGVFIGIIFGSIPGLSATMAIIMFLPMTYTMTPSRGLITLVSLYIGGVSGGLISAILLNIPGTPASIATVFDGYPMTQKGQAAKALGLGVVFSFLGTLIGILLLVAITPLLASVALKFGPYEFFALVFFLFAWWSP